MDFSNTTAKDGLIQQCEMNLFGDSGFGKISGNADRLQIFTNLLNEGYSRYGVLALISDNSWYFDDNNYTDFPVGSTDLINGQADYTLNNSQIIVEQVEVMDPTGTIWMACPQIDERQFAEYQQAESQYNNNVNALPRQHVKRGNSIILFPTPNYSITQAGNGTPGVRVRFKRPLSYFVKTDTTKQPGYNRMHATYLSDYASMKYASTRGMKTQTSNFAALVQQWEETTIPQFYGTTRSSERPSRMMPRYRSPR